MSTMDTLKELIQQVAVTRQQFIQTVSGLNAEQVLFKPSPEAWSIVNNVEHLVWAELGGINNIWKALDGIRSNTPVWTTEAIHRGLSVDEIIRKTWSPKLKAPEILQPKWGGPIEFWIAALNGCQLMLDALSNALTGFDLEKIIYPHPVSGPLDVLQRMGFLRFHLNRHLVQVESIKSHFDFPK